MKRNTTPQWLDFLSALNYSPFTLSGLNKLCPPGVYHCTETETVHVLHSVKGQLYFNVFHMTED